MRLIVMGQQAFGKDVLAKLLDTGTDEVVAVYCEPDRDGKPVHQRGISPEPGIYFLGLPWQSRRGSTFIWGVWHDAKHVADHIATQRKYQSYRPTPVRQTEDA